MNNAFFIGLLISVYSPILLIGFLITKKLYNVYRDGKIDAKRRKTFKVVENNQKF